MIIITIALLIFWFYFCMHLYEIDYFNRKKAPKERFKERYKIPIWVHLIAIFSLCIPYFNIFAFLSALVTYNVIKEELDIEFKDNFFCKIGDLFMKEV